MIIRTPRSRLAGAIDFLVTALAWAAFAYLLLAGMWNLLLSTRAGPNISCLERLLPSLATLGIYTAVALFNAALLLAWARYNALRFSGVDRRSAPAPIDDQALALRFGVPLLHRVDMAASRIMTVHHNAQGEIVGVDFHSPLTGRSGQPLEDDAAQEPAASVPPDSWIAPVLALRA